MPSGGEWARPIGEWAKEKQLDCVVWTALTYKWNRNGDRIASVDEVVEYFRQLRRKGEHQEAEEYVRKTPSQIRTGYRERIERELGWVSTD